MPGIIGLYTWTSGAAVQENEQSTEFTAAATLRDVERVPGFWGSALKFAKDSALVEATLPVDPHLAPFPRAAIVSIRPPVAVDAGWSFSMWFLPTRRAERNHQLLCTFDEALSPFELRLTPADKLQLYSSKDLDMHAAAEEAAEGETDQVAAKRSGTSEQFIRFGDWNHVVVLQQGYLRMVYLNGEICPDCTHNAARPSNMDALALALSAGSDGMPLTRPLRAVRISGPPVAEAPNPDGPFDALPGTGRLAFRGHVGALAHWGRPLKPTQVKWLYARSYSENLFHPLPRAPLARQKIGTHGTEIWSGSRFSSWAEQLFADPEGAREHVRRGGSLILPVGKDKDEAGRNADLAAVERCLGISLELAKPLPTEVGPTLLQDDWPGTFAGSCPPEVTPKPSTQAFSCKKLPLGARVLYGHGVADAFVGTMGDSRVSYFGYAAGNDAGWKTVLGRMLRGQVNFDV